MCLQIAKLKLDCCFDRPLAQQEFFTKPKFSHLIELSDCLSAPCSVIHLDMHTLQVKDLEVGWMFAQWKWRHCSQIGQLTRLCFIS